MVQSLPPKRTKIEAFVAARKRFVTFVEEKFSLRFHMWVILVATILSGVLSSRILLSLHIHNMGVRYPIAVFLSYGVFFLFIKLWFVYVIEADHADHAEHHSAYVSGAKPIPKALEEIIIVDEAVDAISPAEDSGDLAMVAEIALEKAREAENAAKASRKKAGGASIGESVGVGDIVGGGLDLADLGGLAGGGDGCAVGCAGIAAVGCLLGVIYCAGIWFVVEAPAVLSEALFQFLLAGSLLRRMRRMEGPAWMGGVFGLTWKPFFIAAFLACATGLLAHDHCPVAVRWSEAWNCSHSPRQHDQSRGKIAPDPHPEAEAEPSRIPHDPRQKKSGS